MQVCYFALKRTQVGDGFREIGDLIPEAAEWPFVESYVRDGLLGVALVATLPKETRDMLDAWEAARVAEQQAAQQDSTDEGETGDADAPSGEDDKGEAEGSEAPKSETTAKQPNSTAKQKVRT